MPTPTHSILNYTKRYTIHTVFILINIYRRNSHTRLFQFYPHSSILSFHLNVTSHSFQKITIYRKCRFMNPFSSDPEISYSSLNNLFTPLFSQTNANLSFQIPHILFKSNNLTAWFDLHAGRINQLLIPFSVQILTTNKTLSYI